MTKIAMDEIHRTPEAQDADTTAHKREEALQAFMAKAAQAAVDLSPILTQEIANRKLDTAQAIVALLLYTANFSRKAGAKLSDFIASAEQAFNDAEELFASGVVDVLRNARALILKGWCQGEIAMKWVRDPTVQGGKRLTNCHVLDPYASRWSALGAIEAAADAESNRSKARDALVLAIRDAGFQFKPGSLSITVINEYNDVGWAPPLPELKLPEKPDTTDPAALKHYEDTIAKMKKDYETVTVPQWPKPKSPGRTKEEVLAVYDRAIAICGG